MCNHWTDFDFDFGRRISDKEDPEKKPYIFKELKPKMFDKFFKNNTIYLYIVNKHGFHIDENIQDFEMINDYSVKILKKIIIKDPIKFMEQSKMVELIYYKD